MKQFGVGYGPFSHGLERGLAEFEGGLEDTIRRLVAVGKRVYLADDIPHFPFEPNRCRLEGARSFFSDGCAVDARALMAEHEKILSVLNSVIAKSPGVQLIKTYRYFCDAARCRITRDDKLFYRDAHYLNINGSLYVGGIIANRLAVAH